MSETKKVLAAGGMSVADRLGGASVINHNPYPVEVTVRRVAEKVTFEANLEPSESEYHYVRGGDEARALKGKGYVSGQKVLVTIEPLD